MRKYLFRGKRTDNDEWMYGAPVDVGGYVEMYYFNFEEYEMEHHLVAPETIGQYTGMHEFVVSDRSFNKPLFEGDIVEVWSRRRQPTEYMHNKPTSQYDIEVKARAVIRFKYGKWFLDYDNEYNKALCKLRGNEQMERTVEANHTLYDFRYYGDNEDWYREHNAHYKWNDIVKIGNVFENEDLLEG